jgi:hypothetical protein
VTLHVRSNAPAGYQTTVWNGNERLAQRTEPAFDLPVGVKAGVYRVEIARASAQVVPPWITSNPIYVRDPVPDRREVPAPVVRIVAGESLFDGRTTSGWSYESDPTSLSVVDVADLVDGARVRLRYGLSGGSAVGQYAAAAVAVPSGVEAADAVAFTVRAEAPMRISVQVRADVAGAPPERWERSVYVNVQDQDRMVRFADMLPVGDTHQARPPKADVRTIMFVVDTTNTRPGATGRLWLGNVRLVSVASP